MTELKKHCINLIVDQLISSTYDPKDLANKVSDLAINGLSFIPLKQMSDDAIVEHAWKRCYPSFDAQAKARIHTAEARKRHLLTLEPRRDWCGSSKD
jgi:hypothetical protein